MKLTVGQLTAQHIGMHIRVGEHADGTGWRQHPGQSCPLHDAAQPLPLEEEE